MSSSLSYKVYLEMAKSSFVELGPCQNNFTDQFIAREDKDDRFSLLKINEKLGSIQLCQNHFC